MSDPELDAEWQIENTLQLFAIFLWELSIGAGPFDWAVEMHGGAVWDEAEANDS